VDWAATDHSAPGEAASIPGEQVHGYGQFLYQDLSVLGPASSRDLDSEGVELLQIRGHP